MAGAWGLAPTLLNVIELRSIGGSVATVSGGLLPLVASLLPCLAADATTIACDTGYARNGSVPTPGIGMGDRQHIGLRAATMSSMDAFETGRRAEVGSQLDAVRTWADVADVVQAMLADLDEHPNAWENATLPRFLDGLAALAESVDRLTAEGGTWSELQPGPELVAHLLVAASGYE